MVINSLCNTCLQPFELMLEASDLPLIKQISDPEGNLAPCPRLCGGFINLVGEPTLTVMAKDRRLKKPLRIGGKELYQAVNGLGLPDEIPSSSELIQALLKSETVKKAIIEDSNGRLYLHELHMSGGTIIHLTGGLKGAEVLKVTKIHKKRKANGPASSS
jgi:hypothetical protein